MASSSSTGSSTPLLCYVVAEKLTKMNYSLWKAQVLPILHGAQLQCYLDGTKVTPAKTIDGKKGWRQSQSHRRGEPRIHPMEHHGATSSWVSHAIHDQRCHGTSSRLLYAERGVDPTRVDICIKIQGTSCQNSDGTSHDPKKET
jgi:hypothetical protein